MTDAWSVVSETPLGVEGQIDPSLAGSSAAPGLGGQPALAGAVAAPGTAPAATPAPPQPRPQAATQQQPNYGTIDRPLNEEALKAVPPHYAQQVRLLAAGKLQPPSSFAATKPYWQTMLSLAAQYDPQFDSANYSSRAAALKDITSGMTARNLTALNTVMQHIDELDQAGTALDNFKQSAIPYVGPANKARSYIMEAQGDPRIKRFETAANAVANEVEKAFRGSQTAISGIHEWKKQMSPTMSPEQMKEANKTLLKLLDGRVEAVTDQYRRAFGTTRPPIDLLSPKAKATFERLMGDGAHAPNPAQKGNPPPAAAVEMLKKNPALREQFDAKYGPGTAARILGGQQ